jgi:uncharacterized membrane protein
MGALLGLASALAFGVSDYVGGLAARRIHFLMVTIVGEAIGALTTWTCLIWFHGHGPTTGALLWGACSGLGAGAGTIALYRGYGHGEMAVTGPLSAVGAAVVPAVVGISLGDDLPPVGLAGVVLAIPAIWLMSRPFRNVLHLGCRSSRAAGRCERRASVLIRSAGNGRCQQSTSRTRAIAFSASGSTR